MVTVRRSGIMRSTVFCTVVVLLLLLLAAGCGGETTTTTAADTSDTTGSAGGETTSTAAGGTSGQTETTAAMNVTKSDTLLIGGCMPLSGPASVGGLSISNGWKAGVDAVNAAGGITIGDTNYSLEISIEDSKGTVDGATTAATKLCLQDNVKFLVGDITDNLAETIYPISSGAGTLFMVTLPVNGVDVEGSMGTPSADKPLLINAMPPESSQDIVPAQYLAENYPDAKKVAVTALAFSDYDSYAEFYGSQWASLGLTISAYEQFDPTTSDYVPLTTRLLSSNPDAICLSRAGVPGVIAVVKAAREQGFTGPIFYCTPTDASLITQAGENVTDVFGTGVAPDDPNLSPLAQEAVANLKAMFGKDFAADGLVGYDQIFMLAQIISKAQSLDPATVVATFESLTNPGDIESIYGAAHVGGLKTCGANHILVRPVPLSRVVDGQAEFVGVTDLSIP
jgi:branched-chain amino acid transport system substrate-binding protein